MKFARLVNGSLCDPKEAPSLASLDSHYHPDWVAARKAEGTWFQAITDGEYSALNPPPPPVPLVLSWADLAQYLVGLLGGGASGRNALGAIIKSCQASASGADNFFATYFQGQTSFSKAEFTAVLADVSSAIVTNVQKNAVANNWPQR